MRDLYRKANQNGNIILSDRFATTDVNQANALSECLNELISYSGLNPIVVDLLKTQKYKQPIYSQ